jgi:hypothetical protein
MKKKPTTRTEFTFFKDNLIANKFTLTLEELKEKYLAWLQTKEADWVQYLGHQTIVVFVTGKDGLSATPDEQSYFNELEEPLMRVRHELPIYQK